jgi:hypothetical protein
MLPEGTCSYERAYLRSRRRDVLACGHVDPVLDAPAVSVLLWQELRLQRAARFTAVYGELVEGQPEYTRLAQDVSKLTATWAGLLKDLGLTPPARAKLKGGAGDAAAAFGALLRGIEEAERAKAGPAVDVEFEEATEGGDGHSDE